MVVKPILYIVNSKLVMPDIKHGGNNQNLSGWAVSNILKSQVIKASLMK